MSELRTVLSRYLGTIWKFHSDNASWYEAAHAANVIMDTLKAFGGYMLISLVEKLLYEDIDEIIDSVSEFIYLDEEYFQEDHVDELLIDLLVSQPPPLTLFVTAVAEAKEMLLIPEEIDLERQIKKFCQQHSNLRKALAEKAAPLRGRSSGF